MKRVYAVMLSIYLALLCLPARFVAAVAEISNALTIEDGQFSYRSSLSASSDDATHTYTYQDSYFLKSGHEYDHALATMSLCMAMAAFESEQSDAAANIKSLYDDLGLQYTEDSVQYDPPTADSIGYAIGSKTLTIDASEYTLVAVAVRGGGYGPEWASNFTVGMTDEHAGFAEAAETVVNGITAYLSKIQVTKNVKIWITGYSRAAAVTNIAAQHLNLAAESGSFAGLNGDNIYAYCFECPQTVRTDSAGYKTVYENIHCIVNDLDIVTKVAPSRWDYGRYGVTYFLPSAATTAAYDTLRKQMLKRFYEIVPESSVVYDELPGQAAFLDDLVDTLADFFESRDVYVSEYQDTFRAIGYSIGQKTDGEEERIGKTAAIVFQALLANIPSFAAAHPLMTAYLIINAPTFAIAHYPELCLAWMKTINGVDAYTSGTYRKLSVNCPVDIVVFDSKDSLVASIVGDEALALPESVVGAYVDEDGQKVIVLPVDEEYRVRLSATGDSMLTYTVQEYSYAVQATTKVVLYSDIALQTGHTLNGAIDDLENAESAAYALCMPDGTPFAQSLCATGKDVAEYTVSVDTWGNGAAFGAGKRVVGEYAKLTAAAGKNAVFIGWYDKDTLVSKEAEYRFCVRENVALTARFEDEQSGEKADNGKQILIVCAFALLIVFVCITGFLVKRIRIV